jgi:hypothetical protein
MVTLKLNKKSCNLIVRQMILLSLRLLMVLGKELGGAEIHEMTIRPSEIGSGSSQGSAVLAQPFVSHAIGASSISPRPRIPSATYHADTFTVMNTRRRRCNSRDKHPPV